ncbi:MAG: tetratricopeptide repeat protein [Gammaproteobacteria bacterium]|nr:tetratricopeptide repeat protein [Gammaproteobacteria bacterium]
MNRLTPLKILILSLSLLINNTGMAEDNPWSTSYTLEAQGKYQEAITPLLPFINNEVKSEFAMLRIAWLNYLAKNYNESTAYYQNALALNANSIDARLGLMLPLMAQSRWREASFHGEQVLATAPWQYYAHVRLLACEAAQAQWEKVEKHALQVSAHYPTDADSLVFLARAQAKLNKSSEAKATYRKVLQMFPDHLEALKFLVSN